jgi:REP element-mobilizing transposase RayT
MKIREDILENDRFYHLFNRGINSQKIFLNNENYSFFLRKVEKYLLDYFEIYSYCLMPNHFHFIVRTRKNDDLIGENFNKKGLHSSDVIFSKAIGRLISSYTQAFNKVYLRTGALFESPFKRIKIEDENYLKNLIIYIHQNPDNYIDYKFSSYRSIISSSETKIKRREVLELFSDVENFKLCHQKEIYK